MSYLVNQHERIHTLLTRIKNRQEFVMNSFEHMSIKEIDQIEINQCKDAQELLNIFAKTS